MRRAFTLVELLVVVAMLAVLMGAMGSSVASARKRALISKATQDIREMTNAMRAFEQFASGYTLENQKTEGWKECSESSLDFILGKASKTESGEAAPVLYNAHLRNGVVLDPWGKPYQYQISQQGTINLNDKTTFGTAISLPNYYRLTDAERQ